MTINDSKFEIALADSGLTIGEALFQMQGKEIHKRSDRHTAGILQR